MHGARERWKRDRGEERARERERERKRERRGAAQWPVVSVGLHGPVGAAARTVAGVCSTHLLKHRHNTDNGTDAGTWSAHVHRAHRHRHMCTKHMRMQVQRCNGEAGGSSLHSRDSA